MMENTISPALPWDWNQMPPPGVFSLTVFYQGLKHEQVTDFSGHDRLLSSWIINEFLKRLNKYWFYLEIKLFTVPYFPVRSSSRSSAMRCGLPSCIPKAIIPDARPLGTFENQDGRH